MRKFILDRRSALSLIGLAGVGGALTFHKGGGDALPLLGAPSLILVDERAADAAAMLARHEPAARQLHLRHDLVRQWRDGLGQQVLSERGKVVALARWDHTLALDGLAREARRRTVSHKSASGLFRTEFLPAVV
jgi:hypothetical protein